ncbi:MAG: hypothetical protein ACRD3D_13265 [Terriglobia bacterium]
MSCRPLLKEFNDGDFDDACEAAAVGARSTFDLSADRWVKPDGYWLSAPTLNVWRFP